MRFLVAIAAIGAFLAGAAALLELCIPYPHESTLEMFLHPEIPLESVFVRHARRHPEAVVVLLATWVPLTLAGLWALRPTVTCEARPHR